MKLNVNAKELLALYNVLYDRFDGPTRPDGCVGDSDAAQLEQVYHRIRSIILGSLSNKQADPNELFDKWASQEQAKIDRLAKQNDAIKEATLNPMTPLADILTDNDDEVVSDLPYPKPRKGPPNPQMPHGKFKGKKR
jgi:hypothetical protein